LWGFHSVIKDLLKVSLNAENAKLAKARRGLWNSNFDGHEKRNIGFGGKAGSL
jgi:hypothetical protein